MSHTRACAHTREHTHTRVIEVFVLMVFIILLLDGGLLTL